MQIGDVVTFAGGTARYVISRECKSENKTEKRDGPCWYIHSIGGGNGEIHAYERKLLVVTATEVFQSNSDLARARRKVWSQRKELRRLNKAIERLSHWKDMYEKVARERNELADRYQRLEVSTNDLRATIPRMIPRSDYDDAKKAAAQALHERDEARKQVYELRQALTAIRDAVEFE